MKLYSYIVRFDTGFAPNPFWGYCTLATCKPDLRRAAEKGDWIVGTGSKRNNAEHKLIYAMRVTKKLTSNEYFKDKAFHKKIPNETGDIERRGDNIYFKNENGKYEQIRRSFHDLTHKERDLGKKEESAFVLVSEPGEFYYYGREARRIDSNFLWIVKKGPKFKCNFPGNCKIESFVEWVQTSLKPGYNGLPYDYSGDPKGCNNAHMC